MEGISDKAIESIAENTIKLKELYLYACAQISNKAFEKLAQSQITGLQLLEVCGCADFQDETFAAICAKNRGLKSINLTWCTELTDKSIIEGICANQLKLTLLSFFGNINVTKQGLDALIASN